MKSGIHDLINILEPELQNKSNTKANQRDHHVGNLLPLFYVTKEELWTRNNIAHLPTIPSKTHAVTTPLTQPASNFGPLSTC